MTRDLRPDKPRHAPDQVLAQWLATEFQMVPPVSLQQVTGGLSNVTTIATDADGRRVVVRRPPDGPHHGGAHDVLREARILSSLAGSEVPVPVVMAMSEADVIDVPFYVMEHVDGWVMTTTDDAARVPHSQRHVLGLELVDVLASLQDVDLGVGGLEHLRRATPYADRQLRRWSSQWAQTATRPLPAVDHVARRLAELVPSLQPQADCLVHGDFRLGNVIVPHAPAEARIDALLDWELTTVGHPLADLGFLGARMTAPSEVMLGGADPMCAPGYPTFDELARHFADKRGVDLTDLPVFVAMSAWRWAIIVEGIQRRLAQGQMGKPSKDVATDVQWHRRRVKLLAEFAADLL